MPAWEARAARRVAAAPEARVAMPDRQGRREKAEAGMTLGREGLPATQVRLGPAARRVTPPLNRMPQIPRCSMWRPTSMLLPTDLPTQMAM